MEPVFAEFCSIVFQFRKNKQKKAKSFHLRKNLFYFPYPIIYSLSNKM